MDEQPTPREVIGVVSAASAMAAGTASSLDLVHGAFRRIAALDREGPRLGAMPVLDPSAASTARQRDAERASGRAVGPLHGVPFSVKDSFAARGLTAAAGSPAFATVVAEQDAVVVERLRAAGAVLTGKTNMPPMAIGGGQAGLYGRTRSPYNPDYLAAAWHSGSSIGSAVSVAAGFCAFGLGEETVSSGRSPASNNALVAYTPSWGVVPSAGNWPLHPFRDVVVPHTLDVGDMLAVLSAIAGPDDRDIWQRQRAVDVTPADAVASAFRSGALPDGELAGLRVGVPSLYLGEEAGGIAGIPLRRSIRRLWDRLERGLTDAGATVVRVPFPLVELYEGRGVGGADLVTAGYLPADWTSYELGPMMTAAWAEFLRDYAGAAVELRDIAPTSIRPDVPFSVDAVESGRLHPGRDVFDYTAILQRPPVGMADAIAVAAPALTGLVVARERLFTEWMDALGLDCVAFPANSDIGPWDAESNPDAARRAWADGVVFSNMNHVMRRVGLPSATIPMGLADDIGMPVGATLCGRPYADLELLAWARALERILPPRAAADLPAVPALRTPAVAAAPGAAPALVLTTTSVIQPDGSVRVAATATTDGAGTVTIEAAGERIAVEAGATAEFTLDRTRRALHGDVDLLVLADLVDADGALRAATHAVSPFRRLDDDADASAPDPAAPSRRTE